jgi:ElaB/YqjD/DUF883 family membrane-anchored ribosome-binding protein
MATKTTMQELIEEIDSMLKYSNEEHSVGLNAAQNKARNLLEKEKKQIIISFIDGARADYSDVEYAEKYYFRMYKSK